MNREIFVPLLPWLIGGSRIGGIYNTYISSVGTDGSEGCFGKKIFNYRIWIEKIEEDEYLKAAFYFGMNCYESQNEDEITTETFPVTDEGREHVKAYLTENMEKYFAE